MHFEKIITQRNDKSTKLWICMSDLKFANFQKTLNNKLVFVISYLLKFLRFIGILCILGAFVSLCASFWHGKPNTKEKATSFVDFKESRFLSGSAYLSGSFTVIVEDDKRTHLRKSRDSIMSKTPNGYSESVESLFMDRNGLPDNHYLSPLRALDNPTPGTIKKWLTRPERSSDQSLSCSGLQVQEIRLLSDEESVN